MTISYQVIVQAKYGGSITALAEEASSSSSEDEDEDDEGFLASGNLDIEVQNTLEAIRKKDPRVYDGHTKFYTEPTNDGSDSNMSPSRPPSRKPMHLADYHRKNLLEDAGIQKAKISDLDTHVQQQDHLKAAVTQEMHAAASKVMKVNGSGVRNDEDEDDDEDDFLTKKAIEDPNACSARDDQSRHVTFDLDAAEKDPDKFLNDFLSARAWVPNIQSRFEAFESDDEEDERRADAFEEAYNLRFERPETQNDKLVTHARDAVARYTVRKESANPRQRAREIERSKKMLVERSKAEEKARLRKLKIAELQGKMQQIKDAAGFDEDTTHDEDWSHLLNDAWEDSNWDAFMTKRFGEEYYEGRESSLQKNGSKKHSKIKKPKWKDDIDVNDILPNFMDDKHPSTLPSEGADEDIAQSRGGKGRRNGDSNRGVFDDNSKKRQMRLERRQIEQVVDENLDIDEKLSKFGKKHAGHFRYRETSPLSWGMTASDILMADDRQLNEYAGLKKLAPFRDPEKKRRDKRRLGKKARLRQWRMDTFGSRDGPKRNPATHTQRALKADEMAESKRNAKASRKKRKKSETARVEDGGS